MGNSIGVFGAEQKHLVNYHLGEVMSHLISTHPPFAGQKMLSNKHMHLHNQSLNSAIDALNSFDGLIDHHEEYYASILEHTQLNLEDKVRLKGMCDTHVILLRGLHRKQKEALTDITTLFLALSKKDIREKKRS